MTPDGTADVAEGSSERAVLVGAVLESVVLLARGLRSERGPFGDRRLSDSQLDALFLLSHATSPVTPGELAAVLGVTRGAVTQLVDGLRARGLVERAAHPDDARSRILRLSDHARAAVVAFEAEVVERMSPRFDALSTTDLRTLVGLARKIHAPSPEGPA